MSHGKKFEGHNGNSAHYKPFEIMVILYSDSKTPSSRLLIAVAATSVLLTISIIQFISLITENGSEWWKQPYQVDLDRGDGYPEAFPLELSSVRLHVEESVHYALDAPEAFEEWAELQQRIPGAGSVRFGPSHRYFILPMFHELHCIENMRDEVLGQGINRNKKMVGWGHVQHCANYLRQWTLCRADLTLERGDFAERNFTWDRQGATHQCRDWRAVFDAVHSDWKSWVDYWRVEKLWLNIDLDNHTWT
ncbi:hypothetical protein HYPSUDRAFT_38122 [Hypholoma sublateritium FD-334 SS-4]|uniref:Uncharacterized protein n=1 Tax=Hypholoma sublateritium (strain FD-334 SS-4) TaxID=945553 RepID=A0A0D2Q0V7_HYPSF|nr:hypothetical protein HYPSUDRAFT_38122 [Hypholoma sublateritium FD-334 SS-4]